MANWKEKYGSKKSSPYKIEDKDLKKYLGKYNCPNCRNHCYLDSISCTAGRIPQKEKIEEYNKGK